MSFKKRVVIQKRKTTLQGNNRAIEFRSALKTCDGNGSEDPEAAAAVSEMKEKMMELVPGAWKEDRLAALADFRFRFKFRFISFTSSEKNKHISITSTSSCTGLFHCKFGI